MPKKKRNTVMCATRLPEIMVARVDAEAKRLGTSRACFIEMALHQKLDGVAQPVRAPERAVETVKETPARNLEVAGSIPAPATKPDIQALRDICAGKIDPRESMNLRCESQPGCKHCQADETLNEVECEILICGKTWWEDGVQYECLMDKGHREALAGKHGLRGMVRELQL